MTPLSRRLGGARHGHRGHGRSLAPPSLPPERVPAPCTCSDCGGATESKKVEDRHVQDIIPERTINRHFKIETRECVDCGRLFEARLPGVAPRAKYTDALIVTALCQHYMDGRTQGDIGARLKIGRGAFNHAAQRLATALQPSMEVLVRRFIDAPVRFADESGMREDGVNRYAAYGCLPFVLQYCYAHLKRDADAFPTTATTRWPRVSSSSSSPSQKARPATPTYRISKTSSARIRTACTTGPLTGGYPPRTTTPSAVCAPGLSHDT